MATPAAPADTPLNALILTAMMQALDQQKRDELIKQALANLIVIPPKNVYDRHDTKPRSKLEDAFDMAVFTLARQTIEEMVKTDDTIKSKIRELCTMAVEKAFADSDEISTKMAAAFHTAMTKSY